MPNGAVRVAHCQNGGHAFDVTYAWLPFRCTALVDGHSCNAPAVASGASHSINSERVTTGGPVGYQARRL
jgi:hypothetical protein